LRAFEAKVTGCERASVLPCHLVRISRRVAWRPIEAKGLAIDWGRPNVTCYFAALAFSMGSVCHHLQRVRQRGMHRYRVIGYDAKGERLFTLRVEALTKTDARLTAIALLRRNGSGAALADRAEKLVVRPDSVDD
jgi:hypothetical protein